MSYRVVAAIVSLVLAIPAVAQTYVVRRVDHRPSATIHIAREALAGQTIRVWWATLLNADCSAAGTMTTNIVEEPRAGTVEISDKPFPPSYVAPNPRVACDRTPGPGKQAFYTPRAGFHGHDRVVLQNATSDGMIRRIVIDLKVV